MDHFRILRDFVDDHKVLIGSVGACIAVVRLTWPTIFEKRRYPPGPWPWPVIGNGYAMFARSRAEYRYNNWRKYGPVVAFAFGSEWHVDLIGYDAIYEAFVKHSDAFSERKQLASSDIAKKDPGLIFGEHWKELRRHALIVFKDHRMGKALIESKISEEIDAWFDRPYIGIVAYDIGKAGNRKIYYLTEALMKVDEVQTSDSFKDCVSQAVANVTNQIVYGRRLEYNGNMMETLTKFEAFFANSLKAKLIPGYKTLSWLLRWDPIGLHESMRHHENANQFFAAEIEKHKTSLDVENPKDYIDSFLAEAIKTGNPAYTTECLLATIEQLYLASSDTTSTTLTWALLYLLNYPECAAELLNEITCVIGTRPVKLVDRDSMPYTQAFILEVFRCGATTPHSIPHRCSADTVIQGQLVPAGTYVVANLWSTYHDEEIYPDSYSFKPERFLDDQGQVIKQTGKMMLPFSIGKRACLGDGLAKAEMFMFLVSFVQRFEVERRSTDKLSEEGVDIFTHSPQPFEYILIPKN